MPGAGHLLLPLRSRHLIPSPLPTASITSCFFLRVKKKNKRKNKNGAPYSGPCPILTAFSLMRWGTPQPSVKDFTETIKNGEGGFPGGAVVENLPANAEDTGSSPGLGGSYMLRSN